MNAADRIRAKLAAAFTPTELAVIDESHLHAGHAGARPEGETHFRVTVVSPVFAGMSRVAAHRAVFAALDYELRNGVHALAVETRAP